MYNSMLRRRCAFIEFYEFSAVIGTKVVFVASATIFSLDLKKAIPITSLSEILLTNFLLFWKMLCLNKTDKYEDNGCSCEIDDIGAIDSVIFVEFFVEEASGLNYLEFGLVPLD